MPLLFPEFDIEAIIAAKKNGGVPGLDPVPGRAAAYEALALPVGDPSGIIPGLNSSLLALLSSFDPGDLGVCIVDEKIQIVLPIKDWDTSAWMRNGVINLAAAEAPAKVFVTVPADERWELEYIRVLRDSGDNTLDSLILTYPPGFFDNVSGDDEIFLVLLASSGTVLFWPDPAVTQTVTQIVSKSSSIRLEPGTTISVDPSSAGVSASVLFYDIIVTRTKIVRAMGP